jgi:hypothetical protein
MMHNALERMKANELWWGGVRGGRLCMAGPICSVDIKHPARAITSRDGFFTRIVRPAQLGQLIIWFDATHPSVYKIQVGDHRRFRCKIIGGKIFSGECVVAYRGATCQIESKGKVTVKA